MSPAILAQNVFIVALAVGANYAILRFLFRKSIVTLFDPVHVGVCLLSFYLVFLILPFYIKVTETFWVTSALLWIFFLAASIPTSSNVFKAQYLKLADSAQIKFCIVVVAVIALDFAVNTLLSPIPLLSGGGTDTRYLLNQNSRMLAWASSSVTGIPILLAVLSDNRLVKRLSYSAVMIEVVEGILSASKSSLFAFIFLFANYSFLLALRGGKPSRRLRLAITGFAIVTALVLPFYLVAVKVGTDPFDALSLFLVRLVGGFDQLIYWVLSGDPPVSHHLSLTQFYFLPVLKALFHVQPRYNTAIDYLYIEILGFADTKEGMFPNSNLVLEAVFTNGVIAGAFIIAIIGFIVFATRRYLLRQHGLRVRHLILFQLFVMNPFGWLLDGQRFVVSLYSACLFYILFIALANMPLIYSRFRLRLY